MRPARAPGRAGGRPVRPRVRARCVCMLVVAVRTRRAAVRGSWGYAPDGAVRSGAPLARIPRGRGAPESSRGRD
eukprot:2798287-Prymnesium_polylepis.1